MLISNWNDGGLTALVAGKRVAKPDHWRIIANPNATRVNSNQLNLASAVVYGFGQT